MRTQFLYPLIYPLELNDEYFYLIAVKSHNRKHISDLIKKYHIFIDIEIQITRNETLQCIFQVFGELDTGTSIQK